MCEEEDDEDDEEGYAYFLISRTCSLHPSSRESFNDRHSLNHCSSLITFRKFDFEKREG